MFTTNGISKSIIDAVSNVLKEEEEFQPKKKLLLEPGKKNMAEEGDCVTEPEAKKIAKKEVKGHEKSMHHAEENDALLRRIGINTPNKFARKGQTDLHNVPAGNLPNSIYPKHQMDAARAEQPGRLKAAIKSQLGKHTKPHLPEETMEEERHMTSGEKSERERLVKSMKKSAAGFRERYGSRAKQVMYATATKRAMGEEVEQLVEETYKNYEDMTRKELDAHIKRMDDILAKHPEHIHDIFHQHVQNVKAHRAKMFGMKKEEVEQLDELGGISTLSDEATDPQTTTKDTLEGRKKGGGLNQHGPDRKVRLKAEETEEVDESKRPTDSVPFVTNEEDKPEGSWRKESPWKPSKGTVTDKSGAKHTPMSRAKDLARKSFSKIRKETMMGTAGATSEEKSK